MDVMNMPVFLRRWWINKVNSAVENESVARAESEQIQSKFNSQQNTRR